MTKFGRTLRAARVKEWRAYYIDYNFLKHIIESDASNPEVVKKEFMQRLYDELLKVNSFYFEKQKEYKRRYDSLLRIIIKLPNSSEKTPAVDSCLHHLEELQVDLDNYWEYTRLNSDGFRKIVKKYDKVQVARFESQSAKGMAGESQSEHKRSESPRKPAEVEKLSVAFMKVLRQYKFFKAQYAISLIAMIEDMSAYIERRWPSEAVFIDMPAGDIYKAPDMDSKTTEDEDEDDSSPHHSLTYQQGGSPRRNASPRKRHDGADREASSGSLRLAPAGETPSEPAGVKDVFDTVLRRGPNQNLKPVRDLLMRWKWTILLILLIFVSSIIIGYVLDPETHPEHLEPIDGALVHKYALNNRPLQCKDGHVRDLQEDANGEYHLVCRENQLTLDSWITIGVTAATLVALVRRLPSDIVTIFATLVLVFLNVITPAEAWAGFANDIVLSVAVLVIVAKACQNTGVIELLFQKVLGSPNDGACCCGLSCAPKNNFLAQIRLLFPTALFSAFINNTPVVAILMSVVDDWAPKLGMRPKRFLLTLSFGAMVGGVCTIVGTSSNLIMQGLLIRDTGTQFGIFEIGMMGAPCAVASILYLAFITNFFWNDDNNDDAERDPLLGHSRRNAMKTYISCFQIMGMKWKGKRVEDIMNKVGRQENDAKITYVERAGGELLPDEHFPIELADRLHIEATAKGLIQLTKMKTLIPLNADHHELVMQGDHGVWAEVFINTGSPLVGRSIRALDTHELYPGMQVIGVRVAREIARRRKQNWLDASQASLQSLVVREREHVSQQTFNSIKNWSLQAGDSLVCRVAPSFPRAYGDFNSEFLLVRVLNTRESAADSSRRGTLHKTLSGLVLLAMILCVSLTIVPLFEGSLTALFLLVATGCITVEEVFQSVKLRTILTIVGTFGVGCAFQKTSVAQLLASSLVQLVLPISPALLLATMYLLTVLLGSFFHSTATVILMFPICLTAAQQASGLLTLKQILVVVMQGAGSQFLTPISYQTNLMVYHAGGYEFTDFTKIGVGLICIVGTLAVTISSTIFHEETIT